jgi:hypothetical protein
MALQIWRISVVGGRPLVWEGESRVSEDTTLYQLSHWGMTAWIIKGLISLRLLLLVHPLDEDFFVIDRILPFTQGTREGPIHFSLLTP